MPSFKLLTVLYYTFTFNLPFRILLRSLLVFFDGSFVKKEVDM